MEGSGQAGRFENNRRTTSIALQYVLPSGKTYCSDALGDLLRRLRQQPARASDAICPTRSGRGIHFFVGDPPLAPPTVRGSIVLRLAPSFLLDNSSKFLVGRPVDLDGVRFGHLPPLPTGVPAECLELGLGPFLDICSILVAMEPDAWRRFCEVRDLDSVASALERIMPRSLLEYMRKADSFHASAFEYELSADFTLQCSHVASLHVPMTYATCATFALTSLLGSAVRTYDPKYGIEAARS
jgi:hypothetical protein